MEKHLSNNQRHETLKSFIVDKIREAGGEIPFSQYMEYALYTPELGYYMAHPHIFGGTQGKDFITAPEISALFGQSLANVCDVLLKNMPDAVILELGAGTGKLAEDLLDALEKRGTRPKAYWIVDPSPQLREQQKERLKKQSVPIEWFDELPQQSFCGIVIGNEVLDAMPAQCFQVTDKSCFELFVKENNGQFEETYKMSSDPGVQDLAE